MTTGEMLKRVGSHLPRVKYQRGSLLKVRRLVGPQKRQDWWQARYLDYSSLNAHGKPKQRRVWLAAVAEIPKGEAQKRLDNLIARSLSTEPLIESDATFSRWWARWSGLKAAMWSEGTKRGLLPVFKNHVEPVIGQTRISDLTKDCLQALLNGIASKLSRSAVQKARTYLRACLDDALEDGLIERNPARKVELPKTRKPEGGALTQEEIAKLMGVVFGRDRVILRLFTVCGLRPGELFCLRRRDWDRAGSMLRIDETTYEGTIKEPKTETSDSFVFVPPATAAELQALLDTADSGPDDWIFPSRTGKPLRHTSYLKCVLRRAAARAGILKIDFRMLRRSCATQAQRYATVKDTQTQMRHADPALTLRFYQKEIPASVRASFTAMDEALFPEPETKGRLQ